MASSRTFETDRRDVLAGIAALFAGAALPLPAFAQGASPEPRHGTALPLGKPEPYSFEILKARAEKLASEPYKDAPPKAADILETVDFDAYQKIAFKPEMALWPKTDTPFSTQLFHLGRYFKSPVEMHVVEGGKQENIGYTPEAFTFKDDAVRKKLPEDLGYAGFRLMEPGGKADWLAFLGASYFRSAGPDGQYGMSARGLAIDTGLPRPEEFPHFSGFWLHRPKPGATSMVVDALLESESCTGAYRFVISGPETFVMDITANIYVRKDIERLGIAPLTSMYWYGETTPRPNKDWRPEVHDSDGLAMWTGAGERLWRPLNNPEVTRTSTFTDDNPKGFGLLQRDRDFAEYQDDGAFYEKRPGVWIEPVGDWGKGEVQLLEIPTDDEIYDNIAAYWKPAEPIAAGSAHTFEYKLHWVAEEPYPPEVGRVVATRLGQGGIPGQERPDNVKKFVVDFEGGPLSKLKQRFDLNVHVDASRGTVDNPFAIKVVGTDRWRAIFDLEVEGEEPVELRLYLSLDGETLTETWLYQYLPASAPPVRRS
ncbi:glucan biosynthesis protein [Methyloligella solikamskensis]|uniref:Glucan biosynthesis protein n=1 Tax=Methyloligella solikamskensis TaxID=1177756 RepID=A0ABW3JCY5_9HYPH